MEEELVPSELKRRIYTVRGQSVMLSSQLAELYEVEPKVLVQAVKRNITRFPEDFMFQLTVEEFTNLKSQFVTSSWGGVRRANPYAFTEQGVAMLSSVLRSERAVQVNIAIMRAFVSLRGLLTQDSDLARRILTLEEKYDRQFAIVFDAIRRMLDTPPALEAPERRMGFRADNEKSINQKSIEEKTPGNLFAIKSSMTRRSRSCQASFGQGRFCRWPAPWRSLKRWPPKACLFLTISTL